MSIFKDTFPEEIKSQIYKRQDLLVRRSKHDLSYLTSRKAWVRLTSGVDTLETSNQNATEPTNDLASKYVLQGGTLNNDSLRVGIGSDSSRAYSTTTPSGKTHRLGIRPMPGITNIDIKSKSAYGSLREATINFVCWDIRQLEDLELLYMRPGFTALLEWGWSPYIANNDDYKTLVQLYDKFLLKDKLPQGDNALQDIYKELYKLSKDQSGNYDALIGYIKNFQWSFRSDGGYDCSTTLISFGEVLESLKINYAIPEISINDKIKGFLGISSPNYSQYFPTVYNKSKLAGILYEMTSYMAEQLGDRGANDDNGIPFSNVFFGDKNYDLFALPLQVDNSSNSSTQDPSKVVSLPKIDHFQYYISLESLCQLLNNHILITTDKGSLAGVSTLDRKFNSPDPATTPPTTQPQETWHAPMLAPPPPPQPTFTQLITGQNITVKPSPQLVVTGSALLCLTHPLQISVDPSVCLINSPIWIRGFNFAKADENVNTAEIVEGVNETGNGNAAYSVEAAGIVQSIINLSTNRTGNKENIRKQFYNYFQTKSDKDKALQELIIQYEIKTGGRKTKTLNTPTPDQFSQAALYQQVYSPKIPSNNTSTTGTYKVDVVPSFNDFLDSAGVSWDFLTGSNPKANIIGVVGRTLNNTFKYTSFTSAEEQYKLFPLNSSEASSFIAVINYSQTNNLTTIAQTIEDRETYNKKSEEATTAAKSNAQFLKSLQPFFKDNDGYSGLGYISNIYININYLFTLALNQNLESLDKKEKNEINLYDYLKTIMGAVQSSTGNVNNFDIHVDPIDSIGRIIDINFTSENPAKDYDNALVIEIQGTKTTAKNVSLQSQIFPEQSSIVAISAQNGGGTIGLDNNTLVGFNRGIRDRVLPDKYVPKIPTAISTDINTRLSSIGENIGSLAGYFLDLKSLYSSGIFWDTYVIPKYNVANSSEYKNALKDVIVAIKAICNDPNQFRSIIPTKLSITIDGIGGIIIGNIFRIPDDSLPRGYKGEDGVGRKVGFLVTGLGHKIDTGFWETTIDSQSVILEKNDPNQTKIDYEKIIIIPPIPSPGGSIGNFQGSSGGFNQNNIKTAVQFFLSKGFTDEATSAIVGSFLQESQLNPTIVNINDKLSYNSSEQTYAAGIAQWIGPRRVKLLQYAKEKGINIPSYSEAVAIKDNSTKTPNSGNIITSAFSAMTLDIELEFAEKEMHTYKNFTNFASSDNIDFTIRWMYEVYEGGNYTPGAALGSRVVYANDILTRIRNGEFDSSRANFPSPTTTNQPSPTKPGLKPSIVNPFGL
jgi:hypothetical protein